MASSVARLQDGGVVLHHVRRRPETIVGFFERINTFRVGAGGSRSRQGRSTGPVGPEVVGSSYGGAMGERLHAPDRDGWARVAKVWCPALAAYPALAANPWKKEDDQEKVGEENIADGRKDVWAWELLYKETSTRGPEDELQVCRRARLWPVAG